MDPRQPQQQHPFSRNTASSYGRTPFPPTSNQQPPYATTSHPPPSAPAYAEHQRRPSDPPYYTQQQRSYASEGPPAPGPGHSRHQSASSVGIGTPVNRSMPPPSSPQQQAPQQPPHHGYGPLPPRPPPVSVGPPTGFPTNRDLPSISALGRPPSNGSSMSISSMLGGPPPPPREQPSSQYASPITTTAAPSAMYGPVHASPRIPTTAADYAAYRRPQTPEHQRNYEPRDNRANSAGSPPVLAHYSTPEARRFGTPQQTYPQRVPVGEERREPIRVPNPNAIPPRPSSQPSAFNPPPPRVAENPRPPVHNEPIFGRRVDNVPRAPEPLSRQEPSYGRPSFEERHNPYPFGERERLERDAATQREREREALQRLEREQRERAEHENNLYAHHIAQRNALNAYNRPPEPREQTAAWMRPGYESQDRRYEQPPPERPPPPQVANGYEYPTTTAPQYGGPSAYAPPNDHRYGQPTPPQPPPSSIPPQQHIPPPPPSHYEREVIERQRLAQQQEEQRLRQAQQQQQQQAMYSSHQNPQYHHESPQRRPPLEESHQMQQQRSFLGVQEINRKGRVSPLPQAVQGAQGQLNGPGGEPSIKNEFTRVFSGIGSGVGAMGVPSPVSANQGMPFSNPGQLRREDLEKLQDSPVENGHKLERLGSRQGGGRRRKKEEDIKGDDESSTGRRTPSGNGRGGPKRAKHSHAPHHHHHHRQEPAENTSSPSQSNLTPFKSMKGSAIPSPPNPDARPTPTLHHHHVPRHHHHHHHVTPSKPVPPANEIIPLRKPTIRNQAILDAVKHLPRSHLGHDYYRPILKPEGSTKRQFATNRGFASTPKPLPRFEGKENCTFTVVISRVHLTEISREEITQRRAVFGTDVYTDDSDIVAACIHQGWFRGAWPSSVDVSLLDLEIEVESNGEVQKPFNINDTMTSPPATGPCIVPEDRDCHVTIVVLPALERYSSTIRFGLKSREWGFKREGYKSVHDGLSFMIDNVKWVSGVDGQEARSKSSRSKIFARNLDEEELDEERAWDNMIFNANGSNPRWNGHIQESFERGGPRPGDIRDTKNWITGRNGTSSKSKEKEEEEEEEEEEEDEELPLPAPGPPPARILGPLPPPIPSPLSSPIIAPEPVNELERIEDITQALKPDEPLVRNQEREIELITERMIENANTASALAAPPIFPPTLAAVVADVGIKHESNGSENKAQVGVPNKVPKVPSIFG